MTKLRQQFIQALTVRGYSQKTQRPYLLYVAKLAERYKRPPDQLSTQEIQDYLYYLVTERGYAQSSLGGVVAALSFFTAMWRAGRKIGSFEICPDPNSPNVCPRSIASKRSSGCFRPLTPIRAIGCS